MDNQTTSSAMALIIEERQRQETAEGYTTDHDDMHGEYELAQAAQCYETPHATRQYKWRNQFAAAIPKLWPWHASYWKPTPDNRVRELVKAGALYLAEQQRIQRKINRIVKDIESEQQQANYRDITNQPYH